MLKFLQPTIDPSDGIKALAKCRCSPCTVCLKPAPSDPDHWKTRGAGGHDTDDNLVSLCRRHHTEKHTIGRYTFYLKYKAQIDDFRSAHGLAKLTP